MAELAIRKGNGGNLQGVPRIPTLRDLMKWDPFSEMAPLLGAIPTEGIVASFDVKETPNAYIFKADLPGFVEKDLDISAAGDRLTISGNRRNEREDKTDTYYVCERRYGSFARTFTLPQGVDIDHVNAELKQGILTVTVPRVAAAPPKKIAVKSAAVKA